MERLGVIETGVAGDVSGAAFLALNVPMSPHTRNREMKERGDRPRFVLRTSDVYFCFETDNSHA